MNIDATKSPIRYYALIVCFVSMLSGSIALVVGTYDVIQISFPEAANAGFQMQLQQAAEQQRILGEQIAAARIRESGTSLVDGTIAADLASIQIPKPNHDYFVASAIQSLIISMIVLLVSVVVYLFHWRLVRASNN